MLMKNRSNRGTGEQGRGERDRGAGEMVYSFGVIRERERERERCMRAKRDCLPIWISRKMYQHQKG